MMGYLLRFEELPERGKEPNSKRVLDTWINQAQAKTGIPVQRLQWLVAATVVMAALQRAGHGDAPRIRMKGGTYLEFVFGVEARATADVDAVLVGSFSEVMDVVDRALAEPWGPFTFGRTPPVDIAGAKRVVKPVRFKVKVQIRDVTWRSIPVEISPAEGPASIVAVRVKAPRLEHFGLPTPDYLAGIGMEYQVAQKIHACSDPHDPPTFVNDRVRDVTDLVMIRREFFVGKDLEGLRETCIEVFAFRAAEAEAVGAPGRRWPPVITSNELWEAEHQKLATATGADIPLDELVEQVNTWISTINSAAP